MPIWVRVILGLLDYAVEHSISPLSSQEGCIGTTLLACACVWYGTDSPPVCLSLCRRLVARLVDPGKQSRFLPSISSWSSSALLANLLGGESLPSASPPSTLAAASSLFPSSFRCPKEERGGNQAGGWLALLTAFYPRVGCVRGARVAEWGGGLTGNGEAIALACVMNGE